MSKIFENELGIYILHEKFINNVYRSLNTDSSYKINPNLFNIILPFKKCGNNSKPLPTNPDTCIKSGQNEQDVVKLKFYNFISNHFMMSLFQINCSDKELNNMLAIQAANCLQRISSQNSILDLIGGNTGPAVIQEINGSQFLFPENSHFFAKDVLEIGKHLKNEKFDFILLDPPWWNKYIRRKRKASSDAYKMMYNNDLKKIPIGDLLTDDGLIAVWCTNSEQHMNALLTDIFPEWNVNFAAKWYWVKVTATGEPVCNFSLPPGKQPYEKLIFGHRKRCLPLPKDGKLLVSIPSAIHSHKPPLVDVLEDFLPQNPQCLEVFARYLLPNWTSYGDEVLKLQHESLYINTTKINV